MLLDQIKDKNHSLLHNILQSTSVPNFVKKAHLTTEKEAKDLTDSEFIGNRTFPIHTKADTWLSLAYFNKQATGLNPFKKKVFKEAFEKALDLWEINAVLQKRAKTIQKESSRTRYKLDYRHNNNIYHTTHIQGEAGFKKVEEDLLKKASKYTYPIRQYLAEQLIATPFSKTSTHKTELYKTASKGTAYPGHVETMLRKRADLYKHRHQKGAEHITETLIPFLRKEATGKALTKEATNKILKTLDLLDRTCGLHEKYGSEIHPPEQDFFQFTDNDKKLLQKYSTSIGPFTVDKDVIRNNTSKITYLMKEAWNKEFSEDTLEKLSKKQATDILEYIQK